MKGIVFLVLSCISLSLLAEGENIQERFRGKDELVYSVYFNGISVGKIKWEYLGKTLVGNQEADVLYLDSDTNILSLLNLQTKEKVFLDAKSHFPLKVEREVTFFGRKEQIKEIYDQRQGLVKIIKSNSPAKEEFLHPDKPIHNILALLYFFPQDINLEREKTFSFNLPTHKIKMRTLPPQTLKTAKGKKKVYFLSGRGKRKFRLWLDKEVRLPLRLEFIIPVGKIVIARED